MQAESLRQRKVSAKRLRQTWFDKGQRKEANAFLRERLSGARVSVTVADPYFGHAQISQFLHAVPSTHVDFTILTSRLAFEALNIDESDSPSQKIAQLEMEQEATVSPVSANKLQAFATSLKTLERRGMKSVTALVLPGRYPQLHDRFLVIDDEVLFLGNSLNSLGTRASMILAVPDGEPVIQKLRGMASSAMTFEAYAARKGLNVAKELGE